MVCNICKNKKTSLIYSGFPGYIEGDIYDIYECEECDSQFAHPNQVDPKIYDIIYSDRNTKEGPAGYGQHLIQAEEIKSKEDPLEYLLSTDWTFFTAYDYLKGKRGLNILEIGTGYGYLAYALNKIGHYATGIDISNFTISYAIKNFGPNYIHSTISEYLDNYPNNKFDLIVAVEVIEHVTDPNNFIKECAGLLKSSGRIILTTPNKAYFRKNSIWLNDQPRLYLISYNY